MSLWGYRVAGTLTLCALLCLCPGVSLGEKEETDALPESEAGAPTPEGPQEQPEPDVTDIPQLRIVREVKLTRRQRTLIRRPDRRRPEEELAIEIFGRPLVFGLQYANTTDYFAGLLKTFPDEACPTDARVNGACGSQKYVRMNQTLQFDVFYPISEDISIFLGGVAFWGNRFWANDDSEEAELDIRRGEMWLYASNILETPLGLQVGRQRFYDTREWWWDSDLDAVRLRFDLEKFHFEVAAANQFWKISTEDPFLDPEDEDLLRVLGQGSWEWSRRQRLSLFAAWQNDRSDPHEIGVIIDPDEEDDADGDLVWFGASAEGRVKLGEWGRLFYWGNVAGVTGRETSYDFTTVRPEQLDEPGEEFKLECGEEVGDRCLPADGIHDYKVGGWGVDLWATWQTPLAWEPTLSVGYAFGSGKKNMIEDEDSGFRQTGLQDNNARFRGVDRFRYYGEFLDPELSNLHITSLSLGFRFLRHSSVELIHHYYWQAHAAPYLRDVKFSRDPNTSFISDPPPDTGVSRDRSGKDRSIGHEIDLIVGIEEWKHVEIELVGSLFRYGPAFLEDEGELGFRAKAQLKLNF